MPDCGDEKQAPAALVLTGGFMLAEIAGGLLSGSHALPAGAGMPAIPLAQEAVQP